MITNEDGNRSNTNTGNNNRMNDNSNAIISIIISSSNLYR